jgi:hypothetical protein
MAVEVANVIQALASVLPSAAGPAVAPTFDGTSPGFNPSFAAGCTHTAVGQYNLVVDESVEKTNGGMALVTAISASPDTNVCFQRVSDTVKRVNTSIAGVASDAVGFSIVLLKRPQA